jgi:hypothetical protein
MRKHYINNNGEIDTNPLKTDSVVIINPTDADYIAAGYVEYFPPTTTPYKPTYEERVVELIRERYSIDDELAILRQRDSKPSEFAEYNTYCEECKLKAKAEHPIPEPTEEAELNE